LIVMITLLVGFVLGVFCLVVWQISRQNLRERFDLAMKMTARESIPMLSEGPPPRGGAGFGNSGRHRGRRARPPGLAEQARGRLEQARVEWAFYSQGEVRLRGGGFTEQKIPPATLRQWLERIPESPGPPVAGPGERPERAGPPGQRGFGPGPPRFGQTELMFDWPEKSADWRVLLMPERGGVWIFIRPLRLLRAEGAVLANAFLLGIPAALVLVAIGAWWVAGRAVRPVNRLADAATGVTAEDLSRRLSPEGEDQEFAQLISIYNAMLDRLERGFHQTRRFSADAAHELNTPLTILMGHLDSALQEAEAGSPEQRQFQFLLEEVHRLRAIVDKLMILSRADSGVLRVEKAPLNLADILREVCEEAREIAEDARVETDLPVELPVTGDAGLLRQIFFNLVSNGLKYNRRNGRVWVRAGQEGQWVRVTVGNTGAAIPEEHAPRLFDRFFRADPARNRKARGLGLGLSLAREFVLVHEGTLDLKRNQPDRIELEVKLPSGSAGRSGGG
jgi:signal transduction histidine kinase